VKFLNMEFCHIGSLHKIIGENMKSLFGSGKTFIGMITVAAGAICGYLGYPDVAKLIMVVGGSLGAVGVAHKVQKLVDKK
jgi:hypothetical protein